jgi:hypothetical protein
MMVEDPLNDSAIEVPSDKLSLGLTGATAVETDEASALAAIEDNAVDVATGHRGDEGLLEGVVIQENFEAASDSDDDVRANLSLQCRVSRIL